MQYSVASSEAFDGEACSSVRKAGNYKSKVQILDAQINTTKR